MIEQISAGIDLLSSIVFYQINVGGVGIQLIVVWLALAMLFATFWLGFPQFSGFRQAVRLVFGREHDPEAPGAVSQFAALATALSGTVGLGNIAGVAVGVSVGGPGAVFWMMVIGFFAMALKCAEVTLGLMYRQHFPDGRVRGGPWLTLQNGLASIGRPKLGRFLGKSYAFLLLGGALSLFQVNQSFAQVKAVTGIESGAVYGVFFAVATALVLLGSIRWIARTTSIMVPAMAFIYLGGCLVILASRAEYIPDAIATIFFEAFNTNSLFGGILGAFVAGMRRAVYASEAGVGTAVIAHSQARTHYPASEGQVALLEPFIDTVIICTLTGLTVVVAGTWNIGLEGIAITSAAFALIAPWFPIVLTVAVFLFAYSTVIANGFYGAEGFQHLFGDGRVQEYAWKIAFCCILPLGAMLDVSEIVDFVDSVYFLMAVPNVLAVYLLAGPLKAEYDGYQQRVKARRASNG